MMKNKLIVHINFQVINENVVDSKNVTLLDIVEKRINQIIISHRELSETSLKLNDEMCIHHDTVKSTDGRREKHNFNANEYIEHQKSSKHTCPDP